MKKKILLMMVLTLITMFAVNVHAMTEEELTAKVTATYTVNGKDFKMPTEYLNMYKDYISQFDLSSSDCQYLSDQIDVLEKCAKNNSVTSIKDFQKKCNNEIIKACENVSANTGIKATVLSNGKVSVSKYNKPNEVFAIVDTSLVTNTGSANILYIAGTIALLGAGLLVFKIKKA